MEKRNPLTEEQRTKIRERVKQVDFLRFAAPPKNGNGRITEVTLTGRADLEALAALIGEDIPALLAELERLENANRGLTTVTGAVIEERNSLAEKVEHIRGRHRAVCHGACGLDDACECEERDLFCDECNEQWPCSTVRVLDGSEAGR